MQQEVADQVGIQIFDSELRRRLAAMLAREAKEERRTPRLAFPFIVITLVFAYTFVDNVFERPDGIIISSIFILSMLVISAISRYQRATEFRVE